MRDFSQVKGHGLSRPIVNTLVEWSDMSGPASRKYSTSKRVLKLLEPINLDIWIERITIVKFRMDNGG